MVAGGGSGGCKSRGGEPHESLVAPFCAGKAFCVLLLNVLTYNILRYYALTAGT